MKNGWVTKKLGEVCKILDSRRIPITKKDRKPGPIPYYGATGRVDSVADYIFDERLLLLGEDGADWSAGANSAFIIEGKSWVNNHAHVLRPLDFVSDCWLMYYLNATDLNEWVSGTTVPKLNQRNMCDIPIPIPPLAEQKRIVAKIDAAFEKIDRLKANAEKNLANAKELFQSALDEAMRPKKGWAEKRLGEVCESKLSYGTSSPSKGYDARVRYIRITDIDDNGRLLNDFVSPKEYEAKHVLEDGDLVFARTGATVGKSYMYSPSDGACVYAGYLIRARVDQSIIRPKYLFYFTKTSRYKLFIQLSQAAAAQPNVNAEKYGNMLVPIPPVHEQDEIVSCIGKTQGLILQLQQNYSQQITDCAEMRQAILREALEGRL